jgi:O-6-methylguanine DNA methyltransferase
MEVTYTYFDTPLGTFYAAFTTRGICELSLSCRDERDFIERLRRRFGVEPIQDDGLVRPLLRHISNYLNGAHVTWNFDIDVSDATEFQQAVWTEARRIPYGRTVSYGELARRVGRPRAARAVGAAMGANPLLLIVPCHRVVGADGSLTGFGCGLEVKERLLRLEGAMPGEQRT